jgi:hypothetical protein
MKVQHKAQITAFLGSSISKTVFHRLQSFLNVYQLNAFI